MKTISILIAICLIAVIGTEAGVNRKKKDVAAIGNLVNFDDETSTEGDGIRFKRQEATASKCYDTTIPDQEGEPAEIPCPTIEGDSKITEKPKPSGASIVNVSTPILVLVAAMISIVNSFKA